MNERFLIRTLLIAIFSFLFCVGCYHSDHPTNHYLSLLGGLSLETRITIVGDSLGQWSDGFGLRTKLPLEFKITDISVAGYTTEDWLQNRNRMTEIPTDLWIIELGTNDAMVYGTSGFESRTLELISILQSSPITKILLTTIPLTNMSSIREIIRSNNQILRQLKGTKPNVDFVEIELLFESNPGEIPLYPVSDPIHPNQLGYELMGEAYRKKILGI